MSCDRHRHPGTLPELPDPALDRCGRNAAAIKAIASAIQTDHSTPANPPQWRPVDLDIDDDEDDLIGTNPTQVAAAFLERIGEWPAPGGTAVMLDRVDQPGICCAIVRIIAVDAQHRNLANDLDDIAARCRHLIIPSDLAAIRAAADALRTA